MAEIGDIKQFESHKQLAKLPAWPGRNINQENLLPVKHALFIPASASRVLYLMEAANSVRVHDPVFAEYLC